MMKSFGVAGFLGLFVAFVAVASLQEKSPNISHEGSSQKKSELMSHPRQLTFSGLRSGEGYFSADGKELIFQSERHAGNPFYQIYKMDLATGVTELMSTGKGQTTCAWIHPSKKKVLFSSSHEDAQFDSKAKAEFESRGKTANKYSWSFDENYDIYEKELKSNRLVNLTKAKGYDAEASYSPDGKWVVFASNRQAYTGKISDEDKKMFTTDNSYLMDIYIMKADGSGVKQLTTHKGYDGGPFFSADGKKITWRRFAADGRSAEIYTMNVDGSEQKALTKLNSMSWAPYFHPSGKYIIFTTNIQGYQNFELYLVDIKGERDPVRVTYEDGFDGLPVFSPEGNRIAWTKQNAKGESQIFIANWDHDQALRLLELDSEPVKLSQYSKEINVEDTKRTVYYLASKQMQGRPSGSDQEKLYTQAIANYFSGLGLSPAPGSKNFFNEFEFLSGVKLNGNNKVIFNGRLLELGKDWNPVSYSKSGDISQMSVVFAGYGIQSPATEKFKAFDSYKDIDVKDKWVMVLRDIPHDVEGELRYHLNFYARIQHKVTVARNLGAKGIIIVTGPRAPYKQKLPPFQFEGGLSETSLFVVNISDEFANEIFNTAGKNLENVQKSLDDGSFQPGFDLPEAKITASIEIQAVKSKGRNTLAMLKRPGATQTIVIGAHGDHLGLGLPGVSLATSAMTDKVHYGADDNASGVSGVLELAHWFKANPSATKANLVFAIWSGEELGNLGSSAYLKSLEAAGNKTKFRAYVNMDMIGRMKEHLYVQGLGSSKDWKELIETTLANSQLQVIPQEDPYLPTDAMSFYVQGKVPVISLFTGSHMEYHTPLDTPEKINYQGQVEIVKWVGRLVGAIAEPRLTLAYQQVESKMKNMEGRKFRVYLGTIPDYSQEGVKGVRISGATEKSPAEVAGLKAKDVIVELAGQKIENLYDFTYALQIVKPGSPTSIKIQREGALVELKITPAIKE